MCRLRELVCPSVSYLVSATKRCTKFSIKIFHKTLVSDNGFHEIRLREITHYCRVWKNFNKSFRVYKPILVKFGIEDLNVMPLNMFDFRQNRFSESHNLLKILNEVLFYYYTFFVRFRLHFLKHSFTKQIPLAAQSKSWVCSRSIAGIAGSNPAEGMDVFLLLVLSFVRYRSLRRADHSSREVLPSVEFLNAIVKPR